jgi:restriction endonuclease S subunit
MRFYVVYPPYESQRSIGDILQVIDSRISTEQDKKEVIVNLFKTMLNKLMTGHIRVKNLVMPS